MSAQNSDFSSGIPVQHWSDEELKSMMAQICRNVSKRSQLGPAQLARLSELEVEWGKRTHDPGYTYLE